MILSFLPASIGSRCGAATAPAFKLINIFTERRLNKSYSHVCSGAVNQSALPSPRKCL